MKCRIHAPLPRQALPALASTGASHRALPGLLLGCALVGAIPGRKHWVDALLEPHGAAVDGVRDAFSHTASAGGGWADLWQE